MIKGRKTKTNKKTRKAEKPTKKPSKKPLKKTKASKKTIDKQKTRRSKKTFKKGQPKSHKKTKQIIAKRKTRKTQVKRTTKSTKTRATKNTTKQAKKRTTKKTKKTQRKSKVKSQKRTTKKTQEKHKIKIRQFNGDDISLKYVQLIAHSKFCERNGIPFVKHDYLLHQITNPESVIFVAMDGVKLIGFLIGLRYWKYTTREEIDFDQWTLDIICRDPQEKYKGMGDILIENFLTFAQKNGIDDVEVHATSKATRKVYEKHGFFVWKGLGENHFQMSVRISTRKR